MYLKNLDSINCDIKNVTWSMSYFKNKNYNELTGYDLNRVSSIADFNNELKFSIYDLYRSFDHMLKGAKEEVKESTEELDDFKYRLSIFSNACLIKRELYLEYEKDSSIRNKELITKIRELFREYDEFKRMYGNRFNETDKAVCDIFFEKFDLDEILDGLNANKKTHKHNYQGVISNKDIDSKISESFEELIKQINRLYEKVYQVYAYTAKLGKMNTQDLERAYFKMNNVNYNARNIYNDFDTVKAEAKEYIDQSVSNLENEINHIELVKKAYIDEYLLVRLQLYYCLANSECSNMTNLSEAARAKKNLKRLDYKEINLNEEDIERIIESLYQYMNFRSKRMSKEIKKEERIQKVKSFIGKIF